MGFSDTIRSQLSYETGGHCANPDCRAITGTYARGMAHAGGDAAHIVGESKFGPRGDNPMPLEERNMVHNGLWLCPTCHRKVDVLYPANYEIEMLQRWKTEAMTWWQSNRGRPHAVVAQGTARPVISMPSASSIEGASKFLAVHQKLADELFNLRWLPTIPFEGSVVISDALETQISHLSSRKFIGKSWQDEWATTFRCDDLELRNLMTALVTGTDNLARPVANLFDDARKVTLQPPDHLGKLIWTYLDVFNQLTHRLNHWKTLGMKGE